jgi:hypothetical protein
MGGCISLRVLRVDERKRVDGDIPSSLGYCCRRQNGVYVCTIGIRR